MKKATCTFRAIELCAGGGGQAIGLESAGFDHVALIENDKHACATLRNNRPTWPVIETSLNDFSALGYKDIALVSGGVPCPPFSRAGARLGQDDERNLFPEALRIISQCRPRAVMFENVRGFLDAGFESYRNEIACALAQNHLVLKWRLLQASDFGLPQLRPRAVGVALSIEDWEFFQWPEPNLKPRTVGETLLSDMSEFGWRNAQAWSELANRIAPTIVGGSKKHGGADLGPTRAKRQWAALGVNALLLADKAPESDFEGAPKLTVSMAAKLQGFSKDWSFSGGKTAAYRQVGNAFPPPVARHVGLAIKSALLHSIDDRESVPLISGKIGTGRQLRLTSVSEESC